MKDFLKYLIEFQWMYVAYAIPVFLIVLFFYLKNKKAIFSGFAGFVNWIRPSFETGGYASPEKISAFAVTGFVIIPGNIIFFLQGKAPWEAVLMMLVDCGFVLMLFKILSPQQLSELKNGIKPSQPNVPEEKV